MSRVFCVLIFGLLFAIVMVNTTSSSGNQGNKSNRYASISAEPNCTLYLNNGAGGEMCDIFCGRSINITKLVEEAIANDVICSSIGYHLRLDEPQVSSLHPGWFKSSAIINKITIRYGNFLAGNIIDIEPGAFNDCTFRKLTQLTIRKTGITALKRGVFEGANSLKILILDDNRISQIDEYALDPLYQLENMSVINQMQVENLINITGVTQLKQLHTLTLSNNNLGSSIDAETFKGCIRVETLILSNSSIRTIGIGSFDHMEGTIRFLDLSNNHLKNLPSNLLANMIKPNMRFILSHNLWECDCPSLVGRWWDVNNSSFLIDPPLICDNPEKGEEIQNVDLNQCEPTLPPMPEIPTTESTNCEPTTESPKTSTLQPPYLDRLSCNRTGTLYLEPVFQYFNIKQINMGKVSVGMTLNDPTLSIVLINDHDEAECRYDLNRQMYFDDMRTNSAHLFCVIKKNSYTTSPKNCFPFHFTETTSIWGHDEIIIALVCSIVLSLVVGILIGWFLSCRYQRTFKGKSSLQYTSSTTSTRKTISEDFTSSIASDYHGGKLSADGGPNLRRTYSDNSIISCKSYITAVTPSPFEIIQWKLRKNAISTNDFPVRDYLDKLEYDCLPPPLPPYPNRRDSEKIYESIADPIYTCTSEIVPYEITYASPRQT